jgi:hypothetical protein
VSDEELHREEWLAERAALLEFSAGLSRAEAEAAAIGMWLEYEADRKRDQIDAGAPQ